MGDGITQYLTAAIFYKKTIETQNELDTLRITQDIKTRIILYQHILHRHHIGLPFLKNP